MSETWTADQCAAEWGGISASTWRAYVSQGRAPKPLPGYDEDRRRRWDPDAVRSWARPGQGHRTDMTKQPARFELGDRVRVREVQGTPGSGELGTVTHLRSDANEFDVTLDDGFPWVYLSTELDPVTSV